MALFSCLTSLIRRKKKDKRDQNSSNTEKSENRLRTLKVKLGHPEKKSEASEQGMASFGVLLPFDIPGNSRSKVKVMNHESPVEREVVEMAYEGEDEHDDKLSIRRDNSDYNLQARESDFGKEDFQTNANSFDPFAKEVEERSENKSNIDAIEVLDMIQSGHVSDPGMMKVEQWASPKLKRSCSSLDAREVLKKLAEQLPPSKSQSFEQLQELAEKVRKDALPGTPCSHVSAMTHCSADRVMLKKHSSSQILPSRSRRLWWKLFLWSHRNLQRAYNLKTKPVHLASLNQQGGYSSDTLEPSRVKEVRKWESPGSFSEICSVKSGGHDDTQSWDGFKVGTSGLWPQNQWVAFAMESSPLKRVDDWVKDIEIQPSSSMDEGENDDESIIFPPSPETSKSMARSTTHLTQHPKLSEEVLHANNVVRSLNSSSSVAHMSGMGLKVIPIIAHFTSLRSVNLSNNSIVHIAPGSLPKGLHVLNLSRNKITAIEGLRDLTRLRVLDLSYNRITRIGHGLANCTLLKELYLAGNKISDVEGLHRLLKLTVLDLSFNKITTTKALGQLVANYNSLLALNLLGNPIQNNLSEDQLRRAVCGLLPKLAYLNKQPINQQKAREVSMEIVAKASSRGGDWSSRRRAARKVSQGGGMLSSAGRSNAGVALRSRDKLKGRTHRPSSLKPKRS